MAGTGTLRSRWDQRCVHLPPASRGSGKVDPRLAHSSRTLRVRVSRREQETPPHLSSARMSTSNLDARSLPHRSRRGFGRGREAGLQGAAFGLGSRPAAARRRTVPGAAHPQPRRCTFDLLRQDVHRPEHAAPARRTAIPQERSAPHSRTWREAPTRSFDPASGATPCGRGPPLPGPRRCSSTPSTGATRDTCRGCCWRRSPRCGGTCGWRTSGSKRRWRTDTCWRRRRSGCRPWRRSAPPPSSRPGCAGCARVRRVCGRVSRRTQHRPRGGACVRTRHRVTRRDEGPGNPPGLHRNQPDPRDFFSGRPGPGVRRKGPALPRWRRTQAPPPAPGWRR